MIQLEHSRPRVELFKLLGFPKPNDLVQWELSFQLKASSTLLMKMAYFDLFREPMPLLHMIPMRMISLLDLAGKKKQTNKQLNLQRELNTATMVYKSLDGLAPEISVY